MRTGRIPSGPQAPSVTTTASPRHRDETSTEANPRPRSSNRNWSCGLSGLLAGLPKRHKKPQGVTAPTPASEPPADTTEPAPMSPRSAVLQARRDMAEGAAEPGTEPGSKCENLEHRGLPLARRRVPAQGTEPARQTEIESEPSTSGRFDDIAIPEQPVEQETKRVTLRELLEQARQSEANEVRPAVSDVAKPQTASKSLLKKVFSSGGKTVQALLQQALAARASAGKGRHRPPAQANDEAAAAAFGTSYAQFLRAVQDDVDALARNGHIGKAEAAEQIRQAIERGEISKGRKISAADKVRWALGLYSIREKEKAFEPLSVSMKRHSKFTNLPPEQAWRMLMDHAAWGDGRHQGLRFDNEAGYMGAMMRALTHLIEADSEGFPLDGRMYERLHDLATAGVFGQAAVLQLMPTPDTRTGKSTPPVITAFELQALLALTAQSPHSLSEKPREQAAQVNARKRAIFDDPELADSLGLPNLPPELLMGELNFHAVHAIQQQTGELRFNAVQSLLAPRYRQPIEQAACEMRPGNNLTEAGLHEMLRTFDARGTRPHPEDHYYLSSDPKRRVPITVSPSWTEQQRFFLQGVETAIPPGGLRSNEEMTAFLRQHANVMRQRADSILARYHEAIGQADGEQDKLIAIVQCCQSLERAHLFMDGNARTVGFLTLNKLLLENGLPPAMLPDPNHFDGHATAELVAQVRMGQDIFRQYTLHGT